MLYGAQRLYVELIRDVQVVRQVVGGRVTARSESPRRQLARRLSTIDSTWTIWEYRTHSAVESVQPRQVNLQHALGQQRRTLRRTVLRPMKTHYDLSAANRQTGTDNAHYNKRNAVQAEAASALHVDRLLEPETVLDHADGLHVARVL